MEQKLYEKHAGFVPLLTTRLLELAAITPELKVLDLGCGDGVLTRRIQDELLDASLGGRVLGVDPQEDMVAAARRNGVRDVRRGALADVGVMTDLQQGDFDMVFTNATLHWVPDLETVPTNGPDPLGYVATALRPGGVFVGEFGAFGNMSDVAPVLTAAVASELAALRDGCSVADAAREVAQEAWPWYFPTADAWRSRLEATKLFDVDMIEVEHRPTILGSKPSDWCRTFCSRWRSCLPDTDAGEAAWSRALEVPDAALQRSAFEPHSQTWQVQYKRIRFRATRQ